MPFAELAGLTMHYRVAGPTGAPRVVFLNSLGTDFRIWDDLILTLSDRVRYPVLRRAGPGADRQPARPLLDRRTWQGPAGAA